MTVVVINVIAAAAVVFAEAVEKTHGPKIYKDTSDQTLNVGLS
jgi:hypothetical protein